MLFASNHYWAIFVVWKGALSCTKKLLPSGNTVSMEGCTCSAMLRWGRTHQSNIHINCRTQHFPAEHCPYIAVPLQAWLPGTISSPSRPYKCTRFCGLVLMHMCPLLTFMPVNIGQHGHPDQSAATYETNCSALWFRTTFNFNQH